MAPSWLLFTQFCISFVRTPGNEYAWENLAFPRYGGGPKIAKIGHVTPSRPLWPNFAFLSLVSPLMNLRAKFDVSSSNRSRDMEGVPKYQKYVTWPLSDPFWPNFVFLSLVPMAINLLAKFDFSSSNRSRNMEGDMFKIRSRDPFPTCIWGSPVTRYLDSSTPICLFTIWLSWSDSG